METPKILNEVGIVYKRKVPIISNRVLGEDSAEVILRQIFNEDTIDYSEEVVVLYLNSKGEVLHFSVKEGGMTSAVVDVRIIFTLALKIAATSILVAHNHPSGKLYSSRRDRTVTKKLKEAGEILDIQLLDHFILTSEGIVKVTPYM